MAKKKVTEQIDGVTVMAFEPFSIVWDGGVYNFQDDTFVTIPDGLAKYLTEKGKIKVIETASQPTVVEETVVAEPEVVEKVEEPTEEVI